jgi:hypothetical protein
MASLQQIDQRELDEYLFKLKSEINNSRSVIDRLTLRISDIETENVNLKIQISKLAIENSTLEHSIKTKKIISTVVFENYREIISKLETINQ